MANTGSVDLLLELRRKANKSQEDFFFMMHKINEWLTIDDLCGALKLERHEVVGFITWASNDKRLLHKIVDGETYFKFDSKQKGRWISH
jgi:hypothetical protein